MVLRSLPRIRRLYIGVLLLALFPGLYFVFFVHSNTPAGTKIPMTENLGAKDQRHIRLRPATARDFSKLTSVDSKHVAATEISRSESKRKSDNPILENNVDRKGTKLYRTRIVKQKPWGTQMRVPNLPKNLPFPTRITTSGSRTISENRDGDLVKVKVIQPISFKEVTRLPPLPRLPRLRINESSRSRSRPWMLMSGKSKSSHNISRAITGRISANSSSIGRHVDTASMVADESQFKTYYISNSMVALEGTVRPKTCDMCFQPNISYIINPKYLCKQAELSIIVLVVVFSQHHHRRIRDTIRETWGSVTNKNVGVIRLVFVLGDIADEDANAELRKEALTHSDILQGDFRESFRNLTLKTVTSLRWASELCPQAKYFFKTDDDMWVNIPMFLTILPHFQMERAVAGTCWTDHWNPHRDPDDKYYTSELEYPDSTYPLLCVGTAYVMTMSTAIDIYRITPYIPYFHLEDVYVALCREFLGYTVVPLPGFYNMKEGFSVCYYRTKLVTSHWVSEDELREAWTKGCFIEPNDPITSFLTSQFIHSH